MAVFISYSHTDKDFADKLATHLVKARAQVWIDRWELKVGDSLINRIQDAITEAGALLVILSKASVQSEWCKKELSAGLVRELGEKRVLVLPVVIEDCEIPLFLRDKLYADFRGDFEEGLRSVLDSVAAVTSDTRGTLTSKGSEVRWAIDWWNDEDHFHLRLTIIEQGPNAPFSILTEIDVEANDIATKRYNQYATAGFDWFSRQLIFEALVEFGRGEDLFLVLDDQFPETKMIGIRDLKSGLGYDLHVTSRLIGEDTGKSVALNLSSTFEMIRDELKSTLRKPSQDELQTLLSLMARPIGA